MNKYILAIETSSNYLGVGLFQFEIDNDTNNGLSNITNIEKKSTVNHFINNVHDKYLAATVSEILEINDLKVSDLNAVAVSSGPGSFTGLRIGVSFAKALCFEDGVTPSPKLISVSTLKVLVYEFIKLNHKIIHFENKTIQVFLKSHKNIYYTQKFKIEASDINYNIIEFGEIELLEVLHKYEQVEIDFIISNSIDLLELVDNLEIVNLNIDSVAMLGIEKYCVSNFEDAGSFVPQYSQDFQIKVV